MYEPERKDKLYFLVVAAFASIIAWGFFTLYRPIIIEASCSEIAVSVMTIKVKDNDVLGITTPYDIIKDKCIRNAQGR